MRERAPLLIDGNIILPKETFIVRNPATNAIVGMAPEASVEMIDSAVVGAHRAAPGWAALPNEKRRALLAECARVLREDINCLATLQTNESGRPIAETKIEILVAAANFENAGRLLDIHEEEVIEDQAPKRIVVRRSPLGVVAVIAPWNAPIVLGWKPTASALACGNTVVLKPAPETPLTTLRIGELLGPILPPGVLNVVVGKDGYAPTPGERLTSHSLVSKVVFTGSTGVGSQVMAACSKNIKRILLELGGNDAAIVREDVDIPVAARGVFKAAFFNNGQTCCAIKRLYVHTAIFDDFVAALVREARSAKIGNGLNESVELGPLASDVQLKMVRELVEDAKRDGGRVLCGGGAVAGPPGDSTSNSGLFYLPTIVTGIREGSRLVDEEQFGPVLPVMPYSDDNEALRRANGTPFGLGASVWSNDLEKANALADKLQAGTVWVNRHCEFIRNAPFGGMGASGIGRAGDSKRDLNEYTEVKTMVYAKAEDAKPEHIVREVDVGESWEALRERLVQARQSSPSVSAALSKDGSASDALNAYEAAAMEACGSALPPEALQALRSLTEPAGPVCVLLRGGGPAAPEECEAPLYGVMGLLDAHAFTYQGLADQSGPRWSGSQRRSRGNRLVRDFAEVGVAGGPLRAGRISPPYDAPKRFYRPETYVADFVVVTSCASEPSKVDVLDFRELRAASSQQDMALLRCTPISFFDTEARQRLEPMPVVHEGSCVVDLWPLERFEPEGSPEALEAYCRLHATSKRICHRVEVGNGDVLVIDNKRCAHKWVMPPPTEGGEAPLGAKLHNLYASRAAATWPSRVVH